MSRALADANLIGNLPPMEDLKAALATTHGQPFSFLATLPWPQPSTAAAAEPGSSPTGLDPRGPAGAFDPAVHYKELALIEGVRHELLTIAYLSHTRTQVSAALMAAYQELGPMRGLADRPARSAAQADPGRGATGTVNLYGTWERFEFIASGSSFALVISPESSTKWNLTTHEDVLTRSAEGHPGRVVQVHLMGGGASPGLDDLVNRGVMVVIVRDGTRRVERYTFYLRPASEAPDRFLEVLREEGADGNVYFRRAPAEA